MKLKNVIPVTGNIITKEMIPYVRKYLHETTILESCQIKTGPITIECEYDEVMASAPVVAECKLAEEEGFDGVFVNCFGDPGVRAAREYLDIPVFGGFEPAVHIALGLADTIGIVTVLPNVVPMLAGSIARSKLGDRVTSLRTVNIPVKELEDHEKLCNALLDESVKAITEDGVQAIVLGCTAMVNVAETLKELLKKNGFDIPVIEAAQAAVMMLELYAKMGLKQSRITYMKPPSKSC